MDYSGWELKFFDASNNYRKYQFNSIKDYLGKNVLEVGPGSGTFAKKFLLEHVDKLSLAEINNTLYQDLRKNFKDNEKVKIVPKKIEDLDGPFDSICYFDVLEHIKNDDIEILNALKKLKKGGHLIIIVPAFNHLFSFYDTSVGHYRRYEKKFFNDFSKEHNINCIKLFYFDSIGYFFLLINKIINLKNKERIGGGTIIWNLLIPISKLLDKIFFHSFGKSLICVLKK